MFLDKSLPLIGVVFTATIAFLNIFNENEFMNAVISISLFVIILILYLFSRVVKNKETDKK